MNAQESGGPGAQEEHHQREGEEVAAQHASVALLRLDVRHQSPEQRRDDEEESEGEATDGHENVSGDGEVAGIGDGDGEDEQAPGHRIVERSSAHRQRAAPRVDESGLSEDAGEDGEGGDREGGADEHEEGDEGDVLVGGVAGHEVVEERLGDGDAEAEGHDHAADGHCARLLRVGGEQLRVELEADEEEVEHEPEVRHQSDVAQRGRGKDAVQKL